VSLIDCPHVLKEENTVRFTISIVAALMILGLAAFGVVSAQKASVSPSQTTAAESTAAAAPQAATAPARRHWVNPISQISQTAGKSASAPAAAPNPTPVRLAQATNPSSAAAPAGSAPPMPTPTATSIRPCDRPSGIGLARIVEIDTTGGPGFGFEHFKQYDFLRDKEVVLTFDDGPWPGNTPAVLKALADECLKATFFEIGQHATWHPETPSR
jgi:polysaccharide deacetylase